MKWICIMSGALAIVASVMSAQAACPAPQGAVKVALPSGLPPALREADIALPGEPFDASDNFVKGHKHSRYIFVWNIGQYRKLRHEHITSVCREHQDGNARIQSAVDR